MTRPALVIVSLIGLSATALVLGTRSAREANPAVDAGGPAADSPADAAAPATQGQKPTIRFVKNPVPVPALDATDLSGKPFSLAALAGKVVILNFWATWCGPCRAEIPDLVALQNKYRDKLQVVGISVDAPDSESEVRAFMEQFQFNYPVVLGDVTLQRRFGGVYSIPASFIIDAQGRMVQKHIGLISRQLVETEVRALMGLPVDAVVEHVEDTGTIFTANATELPGVELSSLSPRQKATALERLKGETCTCGCGFNLAECRINDPNCAVSLPRAQAVVEEVKRGAGI